MMKEKSMRSFFLFVFFGVLTVAVAEERPLLPVDRPSGIVGEIKCPPFFVSTTVGGVKRVIF
jgi:hypothetical protein